jgi:hypothetical protein
MGNKPVRFPLIEPLTNRNQFVTNDAKVVNGVVEQSTTGILRVLKRPGQKTAFQGQPGVGQGITNYQNNLYSISGDVFSAFGGGSSILTATEITSSAGFSPRFGHFATYFNGSLWVMGGFNSSGVALNDVWSSPDGLTWTNVTTNAPWSARGQGGVIVFNGLMYIMGGGATTGTSDFGDVWSTPDGINWTELNASAWPGRRRFGLTASPSLMYVAGGAGSFYPSILYPDTYYSDVWSSPDGINWTQLVVNAPWVARANAGFFWLGTSLYLIGGLLTDPFLTANSDLWSSPDGISWTRASTNPLGAASMPAYPIAAFDSYGSDFTIPSPITVTGGSGGASATAFVDFDDDTGDDFESGNYCQLWFSNAGSGMTAAPTLTFGTNVGFNAGAYAFLNATSNEGAAQFRTAILGTTVYLFQYNGSGTYLTNIWTTTNGTTYQNIGSPGWAVRNGEFIAAGNLFMIGGVNPTVPTYYNDVWELAFSGTTVALNPNVADGFYHFNQTSPAITTPLLVFKSTGDLYDFNSATSTLSKLSNEANYPPVTVPGLVYLDGYFFVMDTQGRIWNSNLNDPTTWGALAFIAMENEPGNGVAICKYLNYVVAMGQWTTEFFYDNANLAPQSPLSPNQTLAIQIGCAAGESVVELQGSVVWIGQTKREGQGVYQFSGYTPSKISTPFVDRILQADPLTDVSAYTVDAFGHSMYILTLHTSNITLAYTFDSQVWGVWTSMTQNASQTISSLTSDPYGTITATLAGSGFLDGDPILISGATTTGYNGIYNITLVNSNTFTYQVGVALPPNMGSAQASNFAENCFRPVASAQIMDVDYVQDPTNGIIYTEDIEDVTDNGGPVNLVIVTDRFDGGSTTWKYCPRITLVSDIEAYNVVLSYSDNDYQSWSSSRIMSTNQGQRATVTPAGRFRRRAFKVRHCLPVSFRAEALELELIEGDF